MTDPRPPINLLLVDDHLVMREGLRLLIEGHADLRVVGEAGDGRLAVALAKKLEPDVILMDIAMPSLNGVEAMHQILTFSPKAKVLVLSAHSDDEYIKRVITIGAVGYLVKQTSAQGLVRAIREIHKGQRVFSPLILRRLQERPAASASRPPFDVDRNLKAKTARLTSREVEVIQLIAEGSANKQVAVTLKISIKTVEKHRQNLMDKLRIHDTAGLTRYAIAEGIIESSVQTTTD
jgi:DNA-binding NarL/FixJ family response regulator